MKLAYEQQPSTDDTLKYKVSHNGIELHVVIEPDSGKTLKEVLQEYLKVDELELVEKKKYVE